VILALRLTGGLGNQLFQYACGWEAARTGGRELVLDSSGFEHYTLRPFLLGRLRVKARLASSSELKSWGMEGGLWPRIRRRLFGPRIKLIREEGLAWKPLELPMDRELCLQGYWQSELYFKASKKELLKQFQPHSAARGANAAFLKEISRAGSRAVALHLRRGDYVSDPSAAAVHGALGPDYYRAALKRMKNPRLFVFSDEPAWARQNLPFLKGARFAEANPPEAPEEDLRLMSACRHFIIANSSFSWWGAWLGEKASSLVVAPRRWFKDARLDGSGIAPKRWSRI